MNFNQWGSRLRMGSAASVASVLAAGALMVHQPRVSGAALLPDSTRITAVAPPRALGELNDAFATVAARVKPSVVYITATQTARTVQSERGQAMPELPPEFRQFFDFPGMPRGIDPRSAPRGAESSGSGFIVSPDGYILTNAHVVDGASRVNVRLVDRREFQAKVVGTDPSTDVAVIKIDEKNLPAASLGNSDAARVGEWVLAIGNPLGENLTFTVTSGIVSAKGRALDLPNRSNTSIQDFIQTDAAINPGNSGGPLVNVQGEVIGINSAIASPTGTYAGYGFAVPINLARSVMDQLIAHGRVERAALGITVRDAGPNDAEYVGLPAARGVVVQDFSDNSPAKKAGLVAGDVIIGVDGQPIDYVSQLQERVAFRKPGDEVALEVARKGGERTTIRVKVERIPGDAQRTASAPEPSDDDSERGSKVPTLGATVDPVDQQTAQQLQLPADVRGLVVTDVQEGSPASGRLARPNAGGPDVIVAVEGKAVRTTNELRGALEKVGKGNVVTLRVYNAPSKTYRIERVRLAD